MNQLINVQFRGIPDRNENKTVELKKNVPLPITQAFCCVSLAKSPSLPQQWSHAYPLHATLPESTVCYCCYIYASNPWENKLSRLIRPWVNFQSGTSSILRLSHDLGEPEKYLPGTSFRGQANVLVQSMNQSNYRRLYIQFRLWPGLYSLGE